MKKHSSIFVAMTAVALITIACSALSVVTATPQGPQPMQPIQRPGEPFPPPGQPERHPEQPLPHPGQPERHPEQPLPAPTQPGQQPGGQGPAGPQPLQIDRMVDIPGGGGSVEVVFDISNGQWTHIVLSAGKPGMQPYGSMQYPDGMSVDCPPLNTTANGTNQANILLTDPGRYTLTLFDGSNQGGPISVKMVGSQ